MSTPRPEDLEPDWLTETPAQFRGHRGLYEGGKRAP